jgi:hypothetical protein
MVLGLIETGKTILVNYLNGVQLQCLRARVSKKWILEMASNSTSLSCSFKIGHGRYQKPFFLLFIQHLVKIFLM